jgi:phosphatidylserine decarboxylase
MNNYLLKYGSINFIYVVIILFIGIYLKNTYFIILAFIVLIFLIYFFRKPDYKSTTLPNDIISPAFGKITNIIYDNNKILISIFLSVFDPHIQYVPLAGKLETIKYIPGKFNAANFFKKTRYNERCSYYFNTKYGKIIVTQIAGMIARKIVSFIKPNNYFKKGTELGMIKFGSRVDLIIINTNNYIFRPSCNEGDYVYGNKTVLGSFL